MEYDRFATPLGSMVGGVDEKGRVVRLEFADSRQLPVPFRSSSWSRRKGCCEPLQRQLAEYFAGERSRFELKLQPVGTDFQLAMWKRLRRVRYGARTTYGALASALGVPAAVRAVGRANATNPIAIVIPCHRVIGGDGSLTGYGGGVARKKTLLDHEADRIDGSLEAAMRSNRAATARLRWVTPEV